MESILIEVHDDKQKRVLRLTGCESQLKTSEIQMQTQSETRRETSENNLGHKMSSSEASSKRRVFEMLWVARLNAPPEEN